MSKTYSILTVGLVPTDESFAQRHFAERGHTVSSAPAISEASGLLKDSQLDMIYLQVSTDARAVSELSQIQGLRPGLPVVLICPETTATAMLDAWHSGAADVVLLPLTAQALDDSLLRAARQLPEQSEEQSHLVRARFRYLDETGKERW